MPPRKNSVKSHTISMDPKPRRGVRKRIPITKPLTKTSNVTLRIPVSVHLPSPSNDSDDQIIPDKIRPDNSDNLPQKIAKPRLCYNKLNMNGIKCIRSVKEKDAASNNTVNVAPKIKRARAARNQNQNDNNILVKEEATTNKAPSPKKAQTKLEKAKTIHLEKLNEIKIIRANEVINNAFRKNSNTVPIEPTLPPRTRRKANVSNAGSQRDATNNQPTKAMKGQDIIQDVVKKKEIKRAYCKKKSSPVLIEDNPKRLDAGPCESCVAEEIPKKRRKLSLKRKPLKPVVKKSVHNKDSLEEGKDKTTENTVSVVNNATFNSNKAISLDSALNDNKETHSSKPNNISCRKNSGNSTSTVFSWTKDISSSSTTTCFTVKSTDFVRIDHKIPVLKLTNVDIKMKKKDTNDNIFEENSFDSHLDKAQSLPGRCDSVVDLNISQSLKLSTSSITSVTTRNSAQNNALNQVYKGVAISKLRQSLDNLSSKMRNMDMEMINWIGYENDSVNVDRQARIFNFFKEENDVITYCKEIKRVLVGDKYGQRSEVIRENVNEIEVIRPNPNSNFSELSKGQEVSKHVTDDSDKESKDSFGEEDENDRNTEIISHRVEHVKKDKSFDREIDHQDNDDDDALSLFAESITGLESSRKNSSLGMSVSNPSVHDKSDIQPDITDSHRMNGRFVSNNEVKKKPVLIQIVNNVAKQKADSSSVLNKLSDSNLNSKFQTENSRTVDNCDRVSDRCKFQNLGSNLSNNFNKMQNGDMVRIDTFNNRMFSDSRNNKVRSSSDVFENAYNKASELQDGCVVFDNFSNSVNDYRGVTEDFVTVPDNFNNRTSEFESNNMKETSGIVNGSLANAGDDQFKTPRPPQSLPNNKYGSCIFKVCIFNLISKCKNIYCNFTHKQIDLNFVESKLQSMDEESFLRESMYFAKWPILMRKYGICFVNECIRRNLTDCLLEIVSRILQKIRDSETYLVEVVEATLLHLNDADLEACADLLRTKIKVNTCMYDHFMKIISETQNFSRFKDAFIKLTLFIYQIGRSFTLDVATQVLERLCILPYDDALAQTLLKIIEKTNPNIFKTPMMGLLENQLSKNNPMLYGKLNSLKQQFGGFGQAATTPAVQPPSVSFPSPGYITSTPNQRAVSPDSTHIDSVHRIAWPMITRTITTNAMSNTSNANVSGGSDSSEEPAMRSESQSLAQKWRRFKPQFTLTPRRQVYKQPGFQQRLTRRITGTPAKFRHKPPQNQY